MPRAVGGPEFMQALVKQLGLGGPLRHVRIDIPYDGIVTITAEHVVETDQEGALQTALAGYALVTLAPAEALGECGEEEEDAARRRAAARRFERPEPE